MTFGQATIRDRPLRPGREVEEAQRIRDRRTRATDPAREAILAEPEFVDELAVGTGGLDRIEILALEVLDERELELIAIGELPHEGGDAVEASGLRRTKAPLTRDKLVSVDRFRHEDRLKDSVL
jgi:hypothetical protein